MNVLFRIFTFPGRMLSWFYFMFPGSGDVWASARRKNSPGVHLLLSLMIYVGGIWLYMWFQPDRPQAPTMTVAQVQESDVPVVRAVADQEEGAGYPEVVDGQAQVDGPTDEPVETGANEQQVLEEDRGQQSDGVTRQAGDPGGAAALSAVVAVALETGSPQRWRGDHPMAGGYVTVSQPQDYGDRICRTYRYTPPEDAASEAPTDHIACKGGDGHWGNADGQ